MSATSPTSTTRSTRGRREEYPDLPLNEAIREVTTRTEAQFHADVAALGCLPPTIEPRATEFISRPTLPEDMIRLIAKLIDKGHAYAAEGHVLFDVGGDAGLRQAVEPLARRHDRRRPGRGRALQEGPDGLRAVEAVEARRAGLGLALGAGAARAGTSNARRWPARCSATTFDIHGGGIDLVFPHHENEIAQSRCAHGTPVMANYWLHNGFLQVEGEKMAKSAGNFVTIRELLETPTSVDPASRRPRTLWRIGSINGHAGTPSDVVARHYRSPIDWTDRKQRGGYHEACTRWQESCARLASSPGASLRADRVVDALSDDLNTHAALSEIDRLANAATSQTEIRAEATSSSCGGASVAWLLRISLEGMVGTVSLRTRQ